MPLADLIANPHRLLFVGIIFMTHGFSLSPATYAPIAVGYLLASAADLPANSLKLWASLAAAGTISVWSAKQYGGISSRVMLFLILNNFIIPSIRKRFPPESVNFSVALVLFIAAVKMWMHEGIQGMFVGLILFQAVPEVRRYLGSFHTHRWRHVALLICIYALAAPCVYIAFLSAYRPSALQDMQDGWLVRGMCHVMAASRGVPDYYHMLGFAPGEEATPPMIKRAWRKLALQYHPDKTSAKEDHEHYIKLQEAVAKLSSPEKSE